MGRRKGNKGKNKKEYFRKGKRSTKTLEHHVPTAFLAYAQEYRISLQVLKAEIVIYQDENGLHLEHASHKNKSGQRIRLRETYSYPEHLKNKPKSDILSLKDGLLYIDDLAKTEYFFCLENSNGKTEFSFSATDLSRRTPKQIQQLLSAYSKGGLR